MTVRGATGSAFAPSNPGLREAFFEAGGVPGIPTPPPEALPPLTEVEARQKREEAAFRDEFEWTEGAGVDDKYRITQLGEDAFRTHKALKRWLEERPGGPPRPERQTGEAIGPLLCGWSGGICATARIDAGRVVSASPLLDESPEAWITGDALGWCETVIDPEAEKLHAGGDTELTDALLAALHERLFGGEDSGPLRPADLL